MKSNSLQQSILHFKYSNLQERELQWHLRVRGKGQGAFFPFLWPEQCKGEGAKEGNE